MKFIKQLAFAASLATVSGMASATDCSTVLSSYSLGPPSCDAVCQANYVSSHPECFGGSSVTSLVQISSTSFAQISTISSALASRFLASTSGPAPRADAGGVKGMAAGSGKSPWNVWASVGNNNTRISYFANTATRENESDLLNTVLGGDYALSSNMAVGVSVAFDRGSGVGKAAGVVQNSFSSEGYMIAPYLGMQLSKEMAVDISAGFGSGEMTSGSTTTTTSEADRMFYAANLSYNQWMGNVQLLGKLGYLHGEEDYGNSKTNGVANNFTAAENKVDQLRAGVQAGYWMNGVMPYAGLAYSSDVNRSTTQMNAPGNPVGRDAFVWTLGVNFFSLSSGVTGGIAYNQEESRTNQKNNSLMANINLRF